MVLFTMALMRLIQYSPVYSNVSNVLVINQEGNWVGGINWQAGGVEQAIWPAHPLEHSQH